MTLLALLALLAIPATTLALTALAVTNRSNWENRAITGLPSPPMLVLQNAIAIGAGLIAAIRVTPAAGPALAAFVWLAVLATCTDLSSMRVPREPCYAVTFVGLACLAFAPSQVGVVSTLLAAVGLVCLPLLLRALTRNGMGFGDIRLLAAATTTLAWWTGETYLLYALIAAAVAQAVVRAATWPWRSTVGAWEPTGVPSADSAQVAARPRRLLPFAPALCVALLAAAAWVVLSGDTACAQFLALGATAC